MEGDSSGSAAPAEPLRGQHQPLLSSCSHHRARPGWQRGESPPPPGLLPGHRHALGDQGEMWPLSPACLSCLLSPLCSWHRDRCEPPRGLTHTRCSPGHRVSSGTVLGTAPGVRTPLWGRHCGMGTLGVSRSQLRAAQGTGCPGRVPGSWGRDGPVPSGGLSPCVAVGICVVGGFGGSRGAALPVFSPLLGAAARRALGAPFAAAPVIFYLLFSPCLLNLAVFLATLSRTALGVCFRALVHSWRCLLGRVKGCVSTERPESIAVHTSPVPLRQAAAGARGTWGFPPPLL